jgi:hypothetical protein
LVNDDDSEEIEQTIMKMGKEFMEEGLDKNARTRELLSFMLENLELETKQLEGRAKVCGPYHDKDTRKALDKEMNETVKC